MQGSKPITRPTFWSSPLVRIVRGINHQGRYDLLPLVASLDKKSMDDRPKQPGGTGGPRYLQDGDVLRITKRNGITDEPFFLLARVVVWKYLRVEGDSGDHDTESDSCLQVGSPMMTPSET